MSYMILSAVAVTVVAIRGLSFALWQFRRKNILGGMSVTALSLVPAVLIYIACVK